MEIGIIGFYVYVDDNGDVEFNMVFFDFVVKISGECVKIKLVWYKIMLILFVSFVLKFFGRKENC